MSTDLASLLKKVAEKKKEEESATLSDPARVAELLEQVKATLGKEDPASPPPAGRKPSAR
ncbi:MAG: hypothetical protein Q8O25_05825 [Sulfurisoma sp.]|nr:hypothetical protein [Sulfurisoma sp.]